eukprot:COSAG02_NODE_7284_length_3085_cov_1.818151_2_plen_155_part_00
MRSAKYKKLRRQLAAKERAKKARAKEERLRLRREKDEIVAAPHAPDAAICAWLADLDLEQYYPKIRTFGAVNAEELKAISPAELDGIGMRKLEKARFRKGIAEVSKHSTEKIEVRQLSVTTSHTVVVASSPPFFRFLDTLQSCRLIGHCNGLVR